MKAVLIDPFAREVRVVEYKEADNNLAEWYALLDCTCIDMRSIGGHPKRKGVQLMLVCDDEGLYTKGYRQRFFKMMGYPHMLAGKALIVATKGPNTVDLPDPNVLCQMLDGLGLVQWQDERLRFRDITSHEDTFDHPTFGKMNRLTQTPHFSLATDEELANEP
jgi:hypothetical protein